MREKEPMANTQDYGKDEDSSEALLKKHEALLSDLEAFGNTIKSLREQANACRVSVFGQMITLVYKRVSYGMNIYKFKVIDIRVILL